MRYLQTKYPSRCRLYRPPKVQFRPFDKENLAFLYNDKRNRKNEEILTSQNLASRFDKYSLLVYWNNSWCNYIPYFCRWQKYLKMPNGNALFMTFCQYSFVLHTAHQKNTVPRTLKKHLKRTIWKVSVLKLKLTTKLKELKDF